MHRNRNVAILFFTMIVVMMGFGIIIPIMPFYVESFGAGGTELGMLMAIFSIMQFIFSPIWGSLSDRYGRKPFLIMGAFGNALSLLLMGMSTTLWMLFASRALAGILSSATMPTAMAFIADSTDEEHRGGGMGMIGAAMGVGMVLGPGLGGWLAGGSLHTPFFVAAGLSVLAMLAIWVFLPESLPPDQRTSETRIRGPQLGQMKAALFGPMGFLLFLAFLVNFGLAGFEGIFGLYGQARYDFGPEQIGTVMMVVGLISAVAQGLLTGPATRRFGESFIIKASLLGSAIGFPLMLGARNMTGVLLTVAFFVFANAMLRPAIASLASKKAPGGQGMAMGMNNAFQSLGRIVGPLWAGWLFDVHINFPYWSAAFIMFGSFLASMVWLPAEEPEKVTAEPEPSSI
jgi:DHA1 family multidrug resistance protein-like MFS transporter